MIQAMVWSLVFMSGAGTSRSGPMMGRISAVYRRVMLSSSKLREHIGIADHAALGAAEGNVHHRALPGHPRGQRADFIKRHIRREPDAALGGASRDGVLDAVSGEYFQASVVQAAPGYGR